MFAKIVEFIRPSVRVDAAAPVAVGGAAITYLLGGWSPLLKTLLLFVVVDYVTGVTAAAIHGKLNSSVGFKGIAKKIGIFVVVAMGHHVDAVLGDAHLIRDAAVFFYLANELLSGIENLGTIGVPIPPIIMQAVEVLQGKSKGETHGA